MWKADCPDCTVEQDPYIPECDIFVECEKHGRGGARDWCPNCGYSMSEDHTEEQRNYCVEIWTLGEMATSKFLRGEK